MAKYSISNGTGGRISSDAILNEYTRQGRVPLESLVRILDRGISYSYQDFDVLSVALADLQKQAPDVWRRLAERPGKPPRVASDYYENYSDADSGL